MMMMMMMMLERGQQQTCGNAAAQKTNFGQVSSVVDFGTTSFINDRVLAKHGNAKEMIDGLAIQGTGEASGLLIGGHKTTTPVEHEDFTDISPARFTHATLLAFSLPCRYAFVTWFQAYHICTEALHNPVLPYEMNPIPS
jgi:hypothetical protein